MGLPEMLCRPSDRQTARDSATCGQQDKLTRYKVSHLLHFLPRVKNTLPNSTITWSVNWGHVASAFTALVRLRAVGQRPEAASFPPSLGGAARGPRGGAVVG